MSKTARRQFLENDCDGTAGPGKKRRPMSKQDSESVLGLEMMFKFAAELDKKKKESNKLMQTSEEGPEKNKIVSKAEKSVTTESSGPMQTSTESPKKNKKELFRKEEGETIWETETPKKDQKDIDGETEGMLFAIRDVLMSTRGEVTQAGVLMAPRGNGTQQARMGMPKY